MRKSGVDSLSMKGHVPREVLQDERLKGKKKPSQVSRSSHPAEVPDL